LYFVIMEHSEEVPFMFERLPQDLQLLVLDVLGEKDLCNVRLSSKFLKSLADEDKLWKPRVRKFYDTDSPNPFHSWRNFFLHVVRSYSWDKNCMAPGLLLSNSDRSVTSDCQPTVCTDDAGNWRTVRSKIQITPANNYCEFKIDQYNQLATSNTWKIIVGLVTETFQFRLDAWIGIVSGWGYISQNGRKVSPIEAAGGEVYGFPYGLGDSLAVLVDFESDSIFFFKNERCQGMAYKLTSSYLMYFASSLARDGFTVRITPGSVERKKTAEKQCKLWIKSGVGVYVPQNEPHLRHSEEEYFSKIFEKTE